MKSVHIAFIVCASMTMMVLATPPVQQQPVMVYDNQTYQHSWIKVQKDDVSDPPVTDYRLEIRKDLYYEQAGYPSYQVIELSGPDDVMLETTSGLLHHVLTLKVRGKNSEGWGSLSEPVVIYPGGQIGVYDAQFNGTNPVSPAPGKMSIVDPTKWYDEFTSHFIDNRAIPGGGPGSIERDALVHEFQGFPIYRANSNFVVQYDGHARFKFNLNTMMIEYVPPATKTTATEAKFDAGDTSMSNCHFWQKSRIYCVYSDHMTVITLDNTPDAILPQLTPETKFDKIQTVIPATSLRPPIANPDKSMLVGDTIVCVYEQDDFDYIYDIAGNEWLKASITQPLINTVMAADSSAYMDYHRFTAYDDSIYAFHMIPDAGNYGYNRIKTMYTVVIEPDLIRDGIGLDWTPVSCDSGAYCPDFTSWPGTGINVPAQYEVFNYNGNVVIVSFFSDPAFVPPKSAIAMINQYDLNANTWELLYNSSRPHYWAPDTQNPGLITIDPATDFQTFIHGGQLFFAQIDNIILMWTNELRTVRKFLAFNLDDAAGRCDPNQYVASCEPCMPGEYYYGYSLYDSVNSMAHGSQPWPARCESCLQGTYAVNNAVGGCTKCSAGTYAAHAETSLCTSCPPGTYNMATGATRRSMCTPCNAGTKQPQAGQTSCLDCTVPATCPIASATNVDPRLQKFNYTNIRPPAFIRGTAQAASINVLVYIVVGALSGVIIIALLMMVKAAPARSKIRGIVSGLDIYKDQHPTKVVPGPKIERETWTGGIATVVYLMAFIALGAALIVTYIYDNELETTSTLPGIGDNELKTAFDFSVQFHGWPDQCVKGMPITISSTGQCATKMAVTTTALNKAKASVTCAYDASTKTCKVVYVSGETGLSVDSAILVQSRSASALAQAIEWSFSVPSYKIDPATKQPMRSKVSAVLVPDNSTVAIRGASPWQSSVTLTAATYKNLITKTTLRGFIAEYLAFVKGSQQSAATMESSTFSASTDVGVSFKLNVVTAQYNVVIQFQNILGGIALVTQLLAALAGAKGIIVSALTFIEGKLEHSKKGVNINGPKGSGYRDSDDIEMEKGGEEDEEKGGEEDEEKGREEEEEKKEEEKEEKEEDTQV